MWNSLRAFLGGSGIGAFSEPAVVDRLLCMITAPRTSTITVAYLGTATYDLPAPQERQTSLLQQRGCTVVPICVADPSKESLTETELRTLRDDADIILVSGGNTLYAIRRWEETGLNKVLRDVAAEPSRVVLAGGSAGAICWFTSGHSDSADPSTYMRPMIMEAVGKRLTEAQEKEAKATNWSYIRVHGLDVFPGMLCPHFDVTQSNGIRREEDFSAMLRRHPTERGIGIDHWAILILNGDGTYEQFYPPGKTRSAPPGDATGSASPTTPGVFVLDVEGGITTSRRAAVAGPVTELLRAPTGPVVADPFERFFAMSNPTPSSGTLVRR